LLLLFTTTAALLPLLLAEEEIEDEEEETLTALVVALTLAVDDAAKNMFFIQLFASRKRERDKIPNQNFLFSRFFRSPPARLCASGTYYSVVYTNDSLRSVAFYYLLMRVTCKENKRKSKALRSGVFFFPFVFFLSSLFSLSLSMRKDLSKRDLSTLDDVSF